MPLLLKVEEKVKDKKDVAENCYCVMYKIKFFQI